MPTYWKKAKRLCKEKKGILVKDKVLGWYLKLKVDPKNYDTQSISLGVDPGTMFEGYTLLSDKDSRNFQFNFTRIIKNKRNIRSKSSMRRMYRQIRRSRLRHRPIRELYGRKNPMTCTINYYKSHRENFLLRLLRLYPISVISVENVGYDHRVKPGGSGFSNIELSKHYYFDLIRSLGIRLVLVDPHVTSIIRNSIFNSEVKLSDKSTRSFFSHCVDSFSIAWYTLPGRLTSTSVRVINRSADYVRRSLVQFKSKMKWKKEYYRFKSGSRVQVVTHNSKLRRLRVRVDFSPSYHGPWKYVYNTVFPTKKQFIKRYGGTIVRGNSNFRTSWNNFKSKYLDITGIYKYHTISVLRWPHPDNAALGSISRRLRKLYLYGRSRN